MYHSLNEISSIFCYFIGELIGIKAEMQQLEDDFLDSKYMPFVVEASQPCPKRLRRLILCYLVGLFEL